MARPTPFLGSEATPLRVFRSDGTKGDGHGSQIQELSQPSLEEMAGILQYEEHRGLPPFLARNKQRADAERGYTVDYTGQQTPVRKQ